MRGQSHVYNPKTGKFQTQPKKMRVSSVRVRQGSMRVCINNMSGHPSTNWGIPRRWRTEKAAFASVVVNGKRIKVAVETSGKSYSSWRVEVVETAKTAVFGLEKATAIRAAKAAWKDKLGLNAFAA